MAQSPLSLLPAAQLSTRLRSDIWSVCGRFGKPHGVRGEVRLWLYNPQTDLLVADQLIFIGDHPTEQRAAPEAPSYQLKVKSVRADSKGVFLSFYELQGRDQADYLKHLAWLAPRSAFSPLESDEFYLTDLIGAQGLCFAPDEPDDDLSQGRSIGQLSDIFEAGAGDIFVFTGSDLGEVLIPHHESFIIDLDLDSRLIKVRDLPGLINKGEKS